MIINNIENRIYPREIDYDAKYPDALSMPNTKEELIEHIKNTYKINESKLNDLHNHVESLYWNEVEVSIFLDPYGTPRPRLNTSSGTFYVKGADEHKKIMRKMVKKFNIICTTTELVINSYQATPKGLKAHEVLLAEEGKIRPQANPDWDNLGKTYSDMIQGILLLNDNLIVYGGVNKFYSIKPRIEITLRWLSDFDCGYNMRKMMNSKMYKALPDEMKINSKLLQGG